mmetsp:Transcript_32154/g.106403  ORF Transcript_32154/g.106403 Transcript_32154/m.106403 type:complete len:285 (+) Transcript_32154:217-1071(+)
MPVHPLPRLSAPLQHVGGAKRGSGRREARSQAGRGRSTRPQSEPPGGGRQAAPLIALQLSLAHEVGRLVAPTFAFVRSVPVGCGRNVLAGHCKVVLLDVNFRALCLVRLDVSRISAPIQCLAAPVAVGDRGVKNHKGGNAADAAAERVLLIRRVEAVHTCRGLARIGGVELHLHAGRAIAAVIIGTARVAARPGGGAGACDWRRRREPLGGRLRWWRRGSEAGRKRRTVIGVFAGRALLMTRLVVHALCGPRAPWVGLLVVGLDDIVAFARGLVSVVQVTLFRV